MTRARLNSQSIKIKLIARPQMIYSRFKPIEFHPNLFRQSKIYEPCELQKFKLKDHILPNKKQMPKVPINCNARAIFWPCCFCLYGFAFIVSFVIIIIFKRHLTPKNLFFFSSAIHSIYEIIFEKIEFNTQQNKWYRMKYWIAKGIYAVRSMWMPLYTDWMQKLHRNWSVFAKRNYTNTQNNSFNGLKHNNKSHTRKQQSPHV